MSGWFDLGLPRPSKLHPGARTGHIARKPDRYVYLAPTYTDRTPDDPQLPRALSQPLFSTLANSHTYSAPSAPCLARSVQRDVVGTCGLGAGVTGAVWPAPRRLAVVF